MQLNRKEQYILIEGRRYASHEIARLAREVSSHPSAMYADLYAFLDEWFDESDTLIVHTSGSTGKPKEITVRKEQMMQSARLTCEVLKLEEGDSALLCLPMTYIAGKMMVVRALVSGLNLLVRTPSGHPLADVKEPVRLVAMVPLQLYHTLDTAKELERLHRVGVLLIGGGMINPHYREQLHSLSGEVYATYGMTETLSHIALCRLNSQQTDALIYYPLPGVKLSLSAFDTLVIEAPLVCDEVLVTNDVVTLHADQGFALCGRSDNTINSGGIKVQPEVVEEKLQQRLAMPFVCTSILHDRLGEAVVLLVEGAVDVEQLRVLVVETLPANYPCGKYIVSVDEIPLTGNGKIDRLACRKLASRLLKNEKIEK